MIQAAGEIADAVVRRHLWALHLSSELTATFRRMYQPMAASVTPEGVIAALNQAGVKCVLMGAHAFSTWRSDPRATQDVDVLVRKKDVRKAVRALHEAYPDLTISDFPVVARFIDPATGRPVIDVMKPTQTVYHVVFRQTIPVGDTHWIPNLEMALAAKFAAMVSPNRDYDKKLLDAADFANVVRYNRAAINLRKLQSLGDKVYPEGGAEILQMIQDLDAGRPLEI
jgi:hypothetical protein